MRESGPEYGPASGANVGLAERVVTVSKRFVIAEVSLRWQLSNVPGGITIAGNKKMLTFVLTLVEENSLTNS